MDFRLISRARPETLVKESVILSSLEDDMLADLLELKSMVSAPLSATADGGSISTMYYKLHTNKKAPWLFEYMEDLTSGSTRGKDGKLSSPESKEAERLIDLWKQVQEQKKKKAK